MKKTICIVITVIILLFSISVTSFASGFGTTNVVDKIMPVPEKDKNAPVITFSEDFKTLYYKEYAYYQKDLSLFEASLPYEDYELEYYEDYDDVISTDDYALIPYADYRLTETQEKTVKSIDVSGDEIIVSLIVYYKDGTTLSLELLREDYLDDYEKLVSEQLTNYEVDFEYPEGNVVKIDRKQLYENEVERIKCKDYYNDYLTQLTYLRSEDGVLLYKPGIVIKLGDDFYYFSYEENNMYPEYDYGFFDLYWCEEDILVHKITDEETVALLKEAEQAYYEDDFGYLENDELSNSISYFFLVVLFGVVPGIAFVVSLVFAIIKKKTYRKLLFAVCGFTLAEIIAFIGFLIVTSIIK